MSTVTPDYKDIKVILPLSKSIALRVMTMEAVTAACNGTVPALPDFAAPGLNDDIRGMLTALKALEVSSPCDINIGEGGAPLRFFTALAASLPGVDIILRGSERLMERPLAILIDALRAVGADIECLEREGHAPLHIRGRRLRGGDIDIDAGVSSQFLSALMMVSPLWSNPLRLHLTGSQQVSLSYLSMTEKVMGQYGIECHHIGDTIEVGHVTPRPPGFNPMESDWSAASYFYELATLLPGTEIQIADLTPPYQSLQGDAACAVIFRTLGVNTLYHDDGSATLRCDPEILQAMRSLNGKGELLTLNLNNTPDLTPALCVAFCLADMHFRFTGIAHLRHKESDRITALITEMRKLGYHLTTDGTDLRWDGTRIDAPMECRLHIETYHDHRMAMAFAPARLRYPGLTILNPGVVAKSYPDYYDFIPGR